MERFGLRSGMSVEGRLRAPRDGEKYFALSEISQIDGGKPEDAASRTPFKEDLSISGFQMQECYLVSRRRGCSPPNSKEYGLLARQNLWQTIRDFSCICVRSS